MGGLTTSLCFFPSPRQNPHFLPTFFSAVVRLDECPYLRFFFGLANGLAAVLFSLRTDSSFVIFRVAVRSSSP